MEILNKWEKISFVASNPLAPHRPIYGTNSLAFLNPFYAFHAEGIFDAFHEGMSVLDVGCGDGKFFNYLSRRLKNFTYYGIDPWHQSIKWANEDYQDSRAKFGLLGSEVEKEALEKATCMVSLSFFCHTSFPFFKETIKKFKNGPICCSVFLEEIDFLGHTGYYDSPAWYKVSVFSQRQMDEFAEEEGLKITEIEKMFCDRHHTILRIDV